MWIRWVVCAPRSVETLSVSQQRQAAPPCWRRWGHLDAEDATHALIGSMTVKRDGLRRLLPRLSSHLQPNLLCSFHIFCLSAGTRLCSPFCWICAICSLRPSFLHSRCTSVWLRSVYAVAPTWILHEICVKGVTLLPPPSNLCLNATCILNSELCLLNLVSVWFSALPLRVLFYSGLGSWRRHSPAHVTLKVDALSWFISVTPLAIEKFGKLTSLQACRLTLGCVPGWNNRCGTNPKQQPFDRQREGAKGLSCLDRRPN